MTDDPPTAVADPLPGVSVVGLPGLTADATPHEPVPAEPVAEAPAGPSVVADEPAAEVRPLVAPLNDEPVVAADPAADDEPVADPVADETVVEEPVAVAEPAAPPAPVEPESKKKWYVVKVTSGREETIKAAIERKVKVEGLEEFFGQVAIPVERVTEVKKVKVTDKKTGEKVTQEKRVVKERKKFHGYIFAEVEFNDRVLYLFRETSGVGDFVGATPTRPPSPMTDREVQSMLSQTPDSPGAGKKGGKAVVKLDFEKGDKVRIRDGAFANSEGEVKLITEPKDPADTPKVTVVVTIWGRPVDVEVDFWQVDKV